MPQDGAAELQEVARGDDYRVWRDTGISAADLATLGTLGSVLSALVVLTIIDSAFDAAFGAAAPHHGVQRLAEGLGAGALPAVILVAIINMHVWATQAPRRSPRPWAEVPCRGSKNCWWATQPSATRA